MIANLRYIIASLGVLGCTLASANAQVMMLDDYSAGDTVVNASVSSTFGTPVAGVFGNNRSILLTKDSEPSATSVTVGSGVLTWVETSAGDYASVSYGQAATKEDLSAYDRFRITVVSAPASAGQLEVNLGYYGSPTQLYGVWSLVNLPTSGTVDVLFSSFDPPASFPPLDLTQIHDIGLTFRGSSLALGTYTLDNFQAVAVPEVSGMAFVAGMLLLTFAWKRSRG